MATEKECFDMGIEAAYNAQAAGYEIITMVKEDGIFDGDYEYACKKLGEDWDNPEENRAAFKDGWNSIEKESKTTTDDTDDLERCDVCGDRQPQLHYYGESDQGTNGICSSCMMNMQVKDGVFQPIN